MFDASVLLCALRFSAELRLASDDADEIERCAKVVRDADLVRVSPIAWFEVCRWSKPAEKEALADLEVRVHVEALDREVINLARILMQKRIDRWDKDTCRKCGNPRTGVKCEGCGLALSEKTRFNDYLIVAHAESLGVERLYTVDDRMVNMESDVAVKILRPPGIHGPLFDKPPASDAGAIAPPTKRRAKR